MRLGSILQSIINILRQLINKLPINCNYTKKTIYTKKLYIHTKKITNK